jgi:hypothetical protein
MAKSLAANLAKPSWRLLGIMELIFQVFAIPHILTHSALAGYVLLRLMAAAELPPLAPLQPIMEWWFRQLPINFGD